MPQAVSTVGALAHLHAGEALRRGWALPEQLEQPAAGGGGGTVVLRARGVVPWWLTPAQGAVPNDVDLCGLLLLRGPNVAGEGAQMCILLVFVFLGWTSPGVFPGERFDFDFDFVDFVCRHTEKCRA